MIALLIISTISCAALLLLTEPKETEQTIEAASIGWAPTKINTTSITVTIAATIMIFIAANTLSATSNAVAAATITATWLPILTPRMLYRAAITSHSTAQNKKLLEWFRRLRLTTATGMPINAAAVEASRNTTGPGFTAAQGRISSALAAGRDPLLEVLETIKGSSAEPLLQSVIQAERAGAASTDLLDRTLDRTIRAFESDQRTAIDSTHNAMSTVTTFTTIIAGFLILLAVIAGL